MRNFIIALVASIVLPVAVMGQNKIKQEKFNYYSVPVPEDLKASASMDVKSESKTIEKKVVNGKVTYTVRITYFPSSKKEAVYSIGIISDNKEVNKKLSNLSSPTVRPGSISACYSGEKQATPDWRALADCVVQYIQVFL